ncbi:MAG: tripartite tricarboxylate transporter substrate binding protein [Burkholderiales bacterium]
MAIVLMTAAAVAQTYPDKPVRMIVPYPPGGSVDFTGRELAAKLSALWGQQVVLDNRGGAGSTLGHGLGAKATPDGYTLLLGTSAGLVVSPALGTKLSYDSLKDFSPVGLAVYAPFALTLHIAVPANSTKEFIDYAKANPGKINFSSPGTGTPNHLGGELLKALAHINIVHVPYKGGGPALVDLISGQVQMTFSGVPQILPHVKAGRVKIIAIGHPTRIRSLPETPPVADTLPGFNNTSWYGLLAPVGTSPAIIKKINADMNRVLANPEFESKLLLQGVEPVTSTPQGMHEMIASELARWRKVIKDAGISVETAQ